MTHDTGLNTVNKVNVTIVFRITQGVRWGVGLSYSLQMRLVSDRKLWQKPRKDLILMWNCSSCLIITASSIIGTGNKNGVLGGDKQVY